MNSSPENLASSFFNRPISIVSEKIADRAENSTILIDMYDVKPGLTELLLNAIVAPDNNETVQ